MAGLFARLFRLGADTRMDSDELLAAIERAVYKVEPRLKQAGGYPDRYRKSVLHALRYAHELAGAVPGPVDMGPEHYYQDPFVRILFATPEDMLRALCLSHAMHEYARRPEGMTEEVYALMGMRRREKTALGMEAEGEVIRREVAQRVLTFSDHTISGPAPTEQEARELLVWSLFDSLVERVAERVHARRQDRQRLEKEKDYLTAHLRGPDDGKRQSARQALPGLLADLGRATEALDLRHLLEDFEAVLLSPQEHLRLQAERLTLDGMGVIHNGEPAHDRHEVSFMDLFGRDRRRWTVVLVRCHPQPHGPSMADRLQEAGRWLEI